MAAQSSDDVTVGFPLFVSLWNAAQGPAGAATPGLHMRMAHWLGAAWGGGDTRLALQAFRGAGKSTIAGLFAAWRLLADPDTRILVLGAEEGLAARMVDQVRRVVERHPLTGHLKPARAQAWAAGRFTVARPGVLREPSVAARGLGANITGARAEIVICDDVEVPLTCETAGARASLRRRLAEIDFILTPGGTQLYLGTPHSHESIYSDLLGNFRALRIPVLTRSGKSAWPERFSVEVIEGIRARRGPAAFAAQMMLEPVALADSRLDPDLLRPYEGELVFDRAFKMVKCGRRVITGASAWWDPAFGGAGRDRPALAVALRAEGGDILLHDLVYLDDGETVPDEDRARAYCARVAEVVARYRLPSVTVECNGVGRFLPGTLRQVLRERRARCTVREAHASRAKAARILEALDAPLAAGRLHAHEERVLGCEDFMKEMRGWSPAEGGDAGGDDGLDAIAGAVAQSFARLVV